MKRFEIVLALTGLLAVHPLTARAQEWKLAPTTGHAPDVWADGPNWKWDQKNPFLDQAGTWSLWVQPEKNPQLDAAYKPMEAGKAFGYYFVWRYGDNAKEPQHSYRDFLLGTRALDGTPQSSPASVVRFKVPEDGEYSLYLGGTANVQNPTAGYARLTSYTLSADGSKAAQLSTWELNADKPGAFGKYPATMTYNAKVPMKKGDELAVRVQTVNPGPASAGWSSFQFSRFTVTRVPK